MRRAPAGRGAGRGGLRAPVGGQTRGFVVVQGLEAWEVHPKAGAMCGASPPPPPRGPCAPSGCGHDEMSANAREWVADGTGGAPCSRDSDGAPDPRIGSAGSR